MLIVLIAVAATVISVQSAMNLRIDPDFANLIPSYYQSVQAIEKLREHVGAESEAAIAITSPSFADNRSFAEAFINRAMEARTSSGELYFTRVDYKKDVDFLKNNALYFATPSELNDLEDYLLDKKEEAVLEANPFFFDLGDDDDEADSTGRDGGAELQEVYGRLIEKEYPVSDDSTTLVLRFYPAGSQTNIGYIDALYTELQNIADDLDPVSFNPDMEITLAGRLQRTLVEIRAITNDVLSSFGVGVLVVILIVVFYFTYKSVLARASNRWKATNIGKSILRMPAIAVLIAAPLSMSLAWTFGLTYVMFGTLNLMTTTLGLVLFGLGIDYGIHFYARYAEERGLGRTVADAIETTFVSTGQAVSVGALTTSVALFSLLLADFKGFSEFGAIAGTGVLFALLAMVIVLPALLVLFEKYHLLNLESGGAFEMPEPHNAVYPGSRTVVFASVFIVGASFFFLPPKFEYDFGKLEPVYEEYNQRRDVVSRVYSSSGRRNPAYVVLDNREDAKQVTDAVRLLMTSDSTTTILDVESLQERFPITPAEEQEKLDQITRIRELVSDPAISSDSTLTDEADKLRLAAQTRSPIPESLVPESLKKQFESKDGSIGNFVMIYPAVGLSDGKNSIAFSDEIGEIETADGRVFYAGSTSLVAADMLRLMREEAPYMVLFTFLIVALLMWINFGSLKWALLAITPLVVGVMWMLLLMALLDLKLNFYNLIVLPAVLGIGNDAGVHLVHRYREEGFGSVMHVLRSTGEHITVGALTTMVGFAGPLLSFHPGLRSIGHLAVIGIGTTLLATLTFLPALMQLQEKRQASKPVADKLVSDISGSGVSGSDESGSDVSRSPN